eukprot:Sspe_Gene.14095::Locus_4866_Transcript_1_1_Confidence_1.000_Length_739::g.14095::m.14095
MPSLAGQEEVAVPSLAPLADGSRGPLEASRGAGEVREDVEVGDQAGVRGRRGAVQAGEVAPEAAGPQRGGGPGVGRRGLEWGAAGCALREESSVCLATRQVHWVMAARCCWGTQLALLQPWLCPQAEQRRRA